MTKQMLIKWAYDVCICFTPIYFLFDIVFIYGYARLGKYGKDTYGPYLKGAIILTVVLAVNCVAIHFLGKFI